MALEIRRWYVNPAPGSAGPGDGVIALTYDDLRACRAHDRRPTLVVPFHKAMTGPVSRARDGVEIVLPEYRGKAFIPVLAWLAATRLAHGPATVRWYAHKRQGPASVRRLLELLGWQLEHGRAGGLHVLTGRPPAEPPSLEEPAGFTAGIGDASVRMAADFGVFSPSAVDAGSRLLLDVALGTPAVPVLADIGTGYGPLAVGLVRAGLAARALATDVDCVALWLARRNAAANEVPLDAVCSPVPTDLEPTPLTVCNVPTHVNAEKTAAMMAGLLERARSGRLLAVVHVSLEARYTRYFRQAGFAPGRHAGSTHVVLEAAS